MAMYADDYAIYTATPTSGELQKILCEELKLKDRCG